MSAATARSASRRACSQCSRPKADSWASLVRLSLLFHHSCASGSPLSVSLCHRCHCVGQGFGQVRGLCSEQGSSAPPQSVHVPLDSLTSPSVLTCTALRRPVPRARVRPEGRPRRARRHRRCAPLPPSSRSSPPHIQLMPHPPNAGIIDTERTRGMVGAPKDDDSVGPSSSRSAAQGLNSRDCLPDTLAQRINAADLGEAFVYLSQQPKNCWTHGTCFPAASSSLGH